MEGKQIGAIILAAVAVLIGLAFYTGSFSQNIGQLTQTSAIANITVTFPTNGTILEIPVCGQRVISGSLLNATGTNLVATSNYTFNQRISTGDGYLVATLNVTIAKESPWSGKSVNVSCAYAPRGYLEDGGSRGIVILIAIFMSLLILVSAVPNLREQARDFMGI